MGYDDYWRDQMDNYRNMDDAIDRLVTAQKLLEKQQADQWPKYGIIPGETAYTEFTGKDSGGWLVFDRNGARHQVDHRQIKLISKMEFLGRLGF